MFSKIKKIPILLLIKTIRFYQSFISPLYYSVCRFQPTCSEYSVQSLKSHGLFKGLWLTFVRISKCHPFGKSGYDPIPERKKSG